MLENNFGLYDDAICMKLEILEDEFELEIVKFSDQSHFLKLLQTINYFKERMYNCNNNCSNFILF